MKLILYRLTHFFHPILKVLLYLCFVVIYLNFFLGTQDIVMRILYTGVMIIVVAFNLLYDCLKYWYQQLQKAFTIDCDLEKATFYRNKILKYDLLKGMRDSLALSDILMSLDANQPEAILELLDIHQKLLHTTLDYLYISHHSQFKAYTLLNNRTQAQKAYQQLVKLKEVSQRQRNRQISPLYNWYQIDGLYDYIQKDYKKSLAKYKQCNLAQMNPREQLHYHHELAHVYRSLKQNDQVLIQIEAMKEIASTSPLLKEENL